MIETREDLLNGLYYIQKKLGEMQGVMKEYISLERELLQRQQYRGLKSHTKELRADSVKAKSKLALLTICLSFAVLTLLITWVTQTPALILYYAIPLAILALDKHHRKLRIASGAFLVLVTVSLARSIPLGTVLLLLVLGALVIGGEVFFFRFYNGRYVVSKNRKVDAHNKAIVDATDSENAIIDAYNSQVNAERQALSKQYDQLCRELIANTGDWFPPDYYSMDAVEHFIYAVRNQKADNVRDMVLEYDASRDRAQSLEYQRQQSEKLDNLIQLQNRSLQNQEEEKALLRRSNMLLFQGNLINAGAAQRQSRDMRNIRNAVDRNTAAIHKNTAQSASNASTISDAVHRAARR